MRRHFRAVLATLLMLQWGATYGHCRTLHLASADLPGWPVCTVHGPAAEQPPVAPDAALHADCDCPACHQAPFLDPVPTPAPSSQAIAWHPVAPPAPQSAVATLGPRAPPPLVRGPPHHA